MPMEELSPQVLALVAADYVHRDDVSGRFTILSIRSMIGARNFPWTHPQLGVYGVLAYGHGHTALKLRLVDVDAMREPVMEDDFEIDFFDPTDQLEIAFVLSDLMFPEAGDYRLQLLCAGQLLCERRILLVPLENPDQ